MKKAKAVGRFVWGLLGAFMRDDCFRMAAALSYYSIFAMPPLLGIMALVANHFVQPGRLRVFLTDQIQTFIGVESVGRIVTVVQGAVSPSFSGPAAIFGLVALLFGATGAFFQLQRALNTAWGVEPDPRLGDLRIFFVKRAVALLMIGGFGLLLLASLVASTLLSFFRRALRGVTPDWVQAGGLPLVDVLVSVVAVTLVFMIILRYVPDAVVRWRDAVAGGVFTGLLFSAGKLVIAWYLGRTDPANVYGAAGSLAVALLWVYYSAVILLLGAEFTRNWACRDGRDVVPQRGAVVVRREIVYEKGDGEIREERSG